MSAIQSAGGQPQKQPKYASLYTGRIFNGLYTNRSPLRGPLPSMYEQFYRMSYGDVMIAGSNVEVSNRLTLIRRPGNSALDSNVWTGGITAFDEFRVTKAASDVFGTVLEEIFTMVDTPTALYAVDSTGVKQLVFTKSAGAGQTFMQAVGNTLYFSDGIDNKKWLQSLIVRTSASNNFNPQGVNGLAGTYPFMSTFLLSGTSTSTANTQALQQFIGIAAGTITNVSVTSGVLTLTVNMASPNSDTTSYPLSSSGIGTSFMIWGANTATWLNGLIVTSTNAYVAGSGTWTFTANVTHADYASAADIGWISQIGTTPVVARTGAAVPTFGTLAQYVPNTNNNWGGTLGGPGGGNVILDGNMLWVNRGDTVENWGITAPTGTPVAAAINSAVTSWKANTYYSAPGLMIDGSGNLWQVTTPGVTGSAINVGGTAVFTQVSTAAAAVWAAHTYYQEGPYEGAAPWTATLTPPNGSFLPDWKSGKFIKSTAAGQPCVFELQKNIPPSNINVPISAVYGGGAYLQTGAPYTTAAIGWTAAFFNHSNGSGGVDLDWGGSVGAPTDYATHTTPQVPTANATGLSSLMWNFYKNGSAGHSYDVKPMKLTTVNSAGEMADNTYTTPWAGMPASNFEFLQWGRIRIPVSGMTVTFTIQHDDAAFFGIESTAGAVFNSFSSTGNATITNLEGMGTRTQTPWNGYTIIAGANVAAGNLTTISITFPTAGVFGIEFCYAQKDDHNQFCVAANGSLIVPENTAAQPWFESCATTPNFGGTGWNLLSASSNTYPSCLEVPNGGGGNAEYPDLVLGVNLHIVYNGNQLRWFNLGPVTDMNFVANRNVTLPTTTIIDTNSNEETVYESGTTGINQPSPWQTGMFSLTPDISPLQWINEGSIPPLANTAGLISATTAQGWKYWLALVNTLDNTVSNVGPVSAGTGPIINGNIQFAAGSGISAADLAANPQADYVAIFRSTDGGSTPLLINGLGNSYWTVPLTQYMQNGYIDGTPDVELNELIQGALAGENTPPGVGVGGLTFHLQRGWYFIGNTVFFTSGPTTPSGNGNGTNPLNFSQLPSLVIRLVPTAIGVLVFTISDIYIIAGNGTTSNPILPAVPYLTGIGLANYNALDINGAIIGFFTTDKQFVLFNPSAGLDYAGHKIGDKFRQNNGAPGTSWDTKKVQVVFYVNGEDQGWFVSDGQFGWYKLISAPAPEQESNVWSPFATISTGGISAIRSIEVSPGVHRLLVGPSGTGNILARDLSATTDGGIPGNTGTFQGTPFPAYAIFGSYVLALPGQVAKVMFITTDSVKVGSPLILGVILDEALPYYTGSFDTLKHWVTDPPGLPESKSLLGQRFYMAEDETTSAYCRHMQVMFSWPAEAAMNELNAFTVWGAYEVES